MSDKRLKLQNFSLDRADTWTSQSYWQWRNQQNLAERLPLQELKELTGWMNFIFHPVDLWFAC